MRSNTAARWGAIAAATTLALTGLLGASAAHAMPGDQVSVKFDVGDFGSQRTGTTVVRDFTVTNDGNDPVTIDPAPAMTIAAPFARVSTTIVAGERIDPGGTRRVTVSYTAGPVGEMKAQDILFTAVSTNDTTVTGNFPLHLEGKSIATDPVSFEVTDPAMGPSLDFGSVEVGKTSTRTITIRNNGILPLKFVSSALTILDNRGGSVPLQFVGAPFSTTVDVGTSFTFEIAYTPAEQGAITGVVTLVGVFAPGDVLQGSATRLVEFSAAAVAPVTPTASATPTPSVAPAGAGRPGGTTTGTGGRTLASTGADSASVFAGASVALMLLVGGAVVLAQRRRRAKA